MGHDPVRASTLLREIFSNERTRVGFVLGAGCPVSIPAGGGAEHRGLIPDVAGLTTLVNAKLARDMPDQHALLMTYLTAQNAQDGNIEVILTKLRALAGVLGNGEVQGLNSGAVAGLDRAISKFIHDKVSVALPIGESGYTSLARWVAGLDRAHPVEVFTTNYDLLVEEALERDRVTYFDGFTGSKRPFFDVSAIERDKLPPHWTRLWKLHGSINWCAGKDKADVCRLTKIDGEEMSLIHPSHQKYDQSRRLPYLAIIDRLKAFIRRPSAVLVVAGYSFGDEHLNEVLLEGLEGNPTALVIAFMFGRMEAYAHLVAMATRRSNLSVFFDDYGIIGNRPDKWTADLTQDCSPLRAAFGAPDEGEDWSGGNQRCLLGDFAQLGLFLDDVAGGFRSVERAARA